MTRTGMPSNKNISVRHSTNVGKAEANVARVVEVATKVIVSFVYVTTNKSVAKGISPWI